MELTKKGSKEISILILIIALGFLIRLYFWSHLGALSWDEGAHSLAGVMLARTILHGFNINFICLDEEEEVSSGQTAKFTFDIVAPRQRGKETL